MLFQDLLLQERVPESLPQGTVLQRRAQPVSEVIFLEQGVVGLGVLGSQELEHCLGLAQGPCWLEPSAAVLRVPSAVDAVAQTPVRVRRVPLRAFHSTLKACNSSVHHVVQDLARLHQQQSDVAVSRLLKDAEGRCAHWLLQHARDAGGGQCTVEFHERKRQVAQLLGIAPETFSRVFKLLRDRGLISGTGRVVELLDVDGLAHIAGL